MGLFSRKTPGDVIFLMPVRLSGEETPRGQVRMLYCNAAGRVYTTVISRAVYDRARDGAARMERQNKPFATLGLDVGGGRFAAATVEVNSEEAWALEHILEHALERGRVPDIVRKYVRPIIELGEPRREAIIAEIRERPQPPAGPSSRVMERLPDEPEEDIEISVPIYKAEYSYPLVVLKQLPSEEATPNHTRRLLILDSDGDLAVIEVPVNLIRQMERELNDYNQLSHQPTCALFTSDAEGISLSYMTINRAQQKALETLTRYFGEPGSGSRPISVAAKAVLAKARSRAETSIR